MCGQLSLGILALHSFQILVHELNRHRSFADRGSDALDRIGAHIARGKDSSAAGLEQEWLPFYPPVRRLRQGSSSPDKTAVVFLDFHREPISPRQCSDEAEQGRGFDLPLFTRHGVSDL